MSMIRTRWAAVGAAVAIALGGGGIGIGRATIGTGERTVLVPVVPCRLVDTRPSFQVGPRGEPLGPDETYTVVARGSTGECTIPADAIALSTNVTAVGASLPTYLTFWETGTERPEASSLNPGTGQPPAPNAVTTGLSAAGSFDVYNLQGTVHLLVDVNGYYAHHDHDDLYYTKGEIDAMLPDPAPTTKFVSVPPAAFSPKHRDWVDYMIGPTGNLHVYGGTSDIFYAPVSLPDGATIEALHAWVTDTSVYVTPEVNIEVRFGALVPGKSYWWFLDVVSVYEATPGKLTDRSFNPAASPVVDNEDWIYLVMVHAPDVNWGDYPGQLGLYGVTVEYSMVG